MVIPKKSLGQNFLRDENIARKIVDHLQIHSADVIVEIGSGSGALTKHLRKRANHVIGVELDDRAVALLSETFESTVKIVQADILEIRLSELSKQYGQRLRVVGNIPYNITSEILFWLFENRESVSDAMLMIQLEVARRLTAKVGTKEYGILTVFTQFYCHAAVLFRVSPNSFYPRPRVESAVVRLEFKEVLPLQEIRLFRNIVRTTFGKRRKTLHNGLRFMGFDEGRLEKLDFDLNRRPENLSLEDFLHLTGLLKPFEHEVTLSY